MAEMLICMCYLQRTFAGAISQSNAFEKGLFLSIDLLLDVLN